MQPKTTTRKFKYFTWIDVTNPDEQVFLDLTAEYGFDPHFVADSLEIGHLPKIETNDACTFLILRAYTCNKDDSCTTVEELTNKIAVFFNDKQFISAHRFPFDFLEGDNLDFSSVYDLLLYLFRKTVQSYEEPAEWQSSQIDALESQIFLQARKKVSLSALYYQKQETRISKKLLQMTRHILVQIEFPKKYNAPLQDLKDSLEYLLLQYEEVLEDAASITNVYMNMTAQKSNDVMKLLTIFSAFFLPITFIAGIYGMNFEGMPELTMRHGYFYALGLMALVVLIIYQWFKRKRIL